MVEDWYMEDDYTRLKGLYPASARQIQPVVERVCDRLEYEGSPIFDEYPDPCTLRRYGREIYRQMQYAGGRTGGYAGRMPEEGMQSASFGGQGNGDGICEG